MNIRKAVKEDASSVAKVQVDSWKTTYRDIVPDEYLDKMTYESREGKWKDIISNSSVYIAENTDGEIIGFSNGGKERTGKYPKYMGELYAVYIIEAYQRRGVGKLLVEPIINDLIQKGIFSMMVIVLEDNDSRLFYESLGAKKINETKIEISGKKLNALVYGWDDIRTIFNSNEER